MSNSIHGVRMRSMFRRSSRAGMTLLEVMIGFALLIPILLGFSYMALGSASLNRKTELVVAGTNALGTQMAAVVAAAGDNRVLSHGTAKGFVRYLRDMMEIVQSRTNYPIRINYNNQHGILIYEFPVSAPGAITGEITSIATDVSSNQYDLARGVMYVYLREDAVPASFYEWNDLQSLGSNEGSVPSSNTFFDMNGDGLNTGDFSDLLSGSTARYSASDLASLPVSISVMYYPSQQYLNRAANELGPGVNNQPDTGFSSVSLTRNYIINDSAVLGLGIYP